MRRSSGKTAKEHPLRSLCQSAPSPHFTDNSLPSPAHLHDVPGLFCRILYLFIHILSQIFPGHGMIQIQSAQEDISMIEILPLIHPNGNDFVRGRGRRWCGFRALVCGAAAAANSSGNPARSCDVPPGSTFTDSTFRETNAGVPAGEGIFSFFFPEI